MSGVSPDPAFLRPIPFDFALEGSIGVHMNRSRKRRGCRPERSNRGAVGGGRRQFRGLSEKDTHHGQED